MKSKTPDTQVTHAERRLLQAYRDVSSPLRQRLLDFANYCGQEQDAAIAARRIIRAEEGPDTIETNPRDPDFFQGTSIEYQLSVLQSRSPEKYQAAGTLILFTLREEFLKIGPGLFRGGV